MQRQCVSPSVDRQMFFGSILCDDQWMIYIFISWVFERISTHFIEQSNQKPVILLLLFCTTISTNKINKYNNNFGQSIQTWTQLNDRQTHTKCIDLQNCKVKVNYSSNICFESEKLIFIYYWIVWRKEQSTYWKHWRVSI